MDWILFDVCFGTIRGPNNSSSFYDFMVMIDVKRKPICPNMCSDVKEVNLKLMKICTTGGNMLNLVSLDQMGSVQMVVVV